MEKRYGNIYIIRPTNINKCSRCLEKWTRSIVLCDKIFAGGCLERQKTVRFQHQKYGVVLHNLPVTISTQSLRASADSKFQSESARHGRSVTMAALAIILLILIPAHQALGTAAGDAHPGYAGAEADTCGPALGGSSSGGAAGRRHGPELEEYGGGRSFFFNIIFLTRIRKILRRIIFLQKYCVVGRRPAERFLSAR